MMANRSHESAAGHEAAFSSTDTATTLDRDAEHRDPSRHAPYMDLFRGCKLVLDVCCGSGTCLELLRERGIDAIGIDPDASSVGRCVKRGLPARALLPLEMDRLQGPFDGIHVHRVFERLVGDDVIRFLRLAFDSLYAGGLVVVRTPDWDNPAVRGGGFWLDLRNVRPYPLALVEALLREFGFEVLNRGREKGDGLDVFVVARKRSGDPKPDLERLSSIATESARSTGAFALEWEEESMRAPRASSSRAIAVEKPPAPAGPVAARLEGSLFVHDGVGLVNREISLALLKTGRLDLSLMPFEAHRFGPEEDPRFARLAERMNRPCERAVEAHVRHLRTPDFTPPREGRFIEMIAWPHSRVPKAWVAPLSDTVDEVWTPSESGRRAFVESGVPADRVVVVPFGVNLDAFKPDLQPLPLGTQKPFRFLFMGGTIWRKGIDVLLLAYGRAFRRSDPVCLVVKETGHRAHPAHVRHIREMQSDPAAPEILYLGDEFPEKDLPRLYAACHALVHPYRAEAFGLAVAEALACGLPIVLTQGGACDALVPETGMFFVPARSVELRSEQPLASPATVLEPDVEALAAQMREVSSHPDVARTRGRAASETARERLGWDRAAAVVVERLFARRGRPSRRSQPSLMPIPATDAPAVSVTPKPAAASTAMPKAVAPPTPAPEPARPHLPERQSPPAVAESLQANLARIRADLEGACSGNGESIERLGRTLTETHETAARYYLEQGCLEEAQRHLEKLLQLSPGDAPALGSLGSVYYRQGDSKRALDCLQRAIQIAPSDATAHYNLAMLHVAAGRRSEAIAALERAAQLGTDDAELWNNLGVLTFEEGDTATAEQHFLRALAKQPDYVDALLNLSLMDVRLGHFERARKNLAHVLRVQPENAEAQELLAKMPEARPH